MVDIIVCEVESAGHIMMDDGRMVTTLLLKRPAFVRRSIDEDRQERLDAVAKVIDDYTDMLTEAQEV